MIQRRSADLSVGQLIGYYKACSQSIARHSRHIYVRNSARFVDPLVYRHVRLTILTVG